MDHSWSPVSSNEISSPKYAILNNDDVLMIREDDFDKRAQFVTNMESADGRWLHHGNKKDEL